MFSRSSGMSKTFCAAALDAMAGGVVMESDIFGGGSAQRC
jgi:hypothetical protein